MNRQELSEHKELCREVFALRDQAKKMEELIDRLRTTAKAACRLSQDFHFYQEAPSEWRMRCFIDEMGELTMADVETPIEQWLKWAKEAEEE